ncbi:MAG TPA: transposase [Vicinamibacterales bacterium]|nr:transposase [Vicinamibacterales bacterium]
MARPLRIHVPGRAYHIYARGNDKACIFRDDGDHHRFLELLAVALERFRAECLAYCLLWSHYHLLVIPYQHSVSRLMHYLNSRYCQSFNKKHGRVGHVLQGRFGSRIVDDAGYLLTAIRYIALNPVAADRVERPEEWPWSSHRATAGLAPAPPFLTLDRVWKAFNCADATEGRARYITHVAGGHTAEELTRALLFGSELLARQVAPLLHPHRDEIAFTYADRFAARPPLDRIFEAATSADRVRRAAAAAFHEHGYTLGEIAARVGRSPSLVCRWIRRAGGEAAAAGPVGVVPDSTHNSGYAKFKL